MYLEINKFFSEVFSLNKTTLDHWLFLMKLVLLRFSCQVEMFLQDMGTRDSGVLVCSPCIRD